MRTHSTGSKSITWNGLKVDVGTVDPDKIIEYAYQLKARMRSRGLEPSKFIIGTEIWDTLLDSELHYRRGVEHRPQQLLGLPYVIDAEDPRAIELSVKITGV